MQRPYQVSGAPAPLALVAPEYRGPRAKCPVCDTACSTVRTSRDNDNYAPYVYSFLVRSCRGSSWLWRLLGLGCGRQDLHLHQSCRFCKAEWACAPVQKDAR